MSGLIKISSKGEEIFEKEMRHLLEEKRKSRLSILGQDQNESLEKKIFLQIKFIYLLDVHCTYQ